MSDEVDLERFGVQREQIHEVDSVRNHETQREDPCNPLDWSTHPEDPLICPTPAHYLGGSTMLLNNRISFRLMNILSLSKACCLDAPIPVPFLIHREVMIVGTHLGQGHLSQVQAHDQTPRVQFLSLLIRSFIYIVRTYGVIYTLHLLKNGP